MGGGFVCACVPKGPGSHWCSEPRVGEVVQLWEFKNLERSGFSHRQIFFDAGVKFDMTPNGEPTKTVLSIPGLASKC